MKRLIGALITGAAVLACAAAATAADAPVVFAHPAVVRLSGSASVAVRGFAGPRLEVRLNGATTPNGSPLGWRPLHRVGKTWRGRLPTPALRGIYPIEVRAGAGSPPLRSANWMFRVFASGTLSRPSFSTPEDVATWWVRTATRGAQLVALKRWPRPGFDRRDRRLHQLLVVAYSRAGEERLGMFITAVRDGFDGRWRLLEATVQP